MARDELTAITGINKASATALRSIGIGTLMDLVLTPRNTVRATLKAANIQPLPTISEVAAWQDRARQLRLESPPSHGWDREASFVVSFERREGAEGEERQTVVERAEADTPVQLIEEDWKPGVVGEWIGDQIEGAPPATTQKATPFTGASRAPSHTTPPTPTGPQPQSHPQPPLAGIDNPIRYWNGAALEANRVAHTTKADPGVMGPTLSARALALVHLAMHDAYFSIVGTYPPYLPGLPTPPVGASPEAAIEAAARATLTQLHPSQAAVFQAQTAFQGDPETTPGFAEGRAHGLGIAGRMLADCPNYRDAKPGEYSPSSGRGRHRVDPAHPGQGFYGPYHGESRCFAVSKKYELRPPPFDDDEYLEALEQVRSKGIAPELVGTLPAGSIGRTTDETAIGIFWGYDGASGLGTPPRLYNQIVRKVSAHHQNPGADAIADDARLFALVNVAMADAGILAWREKYARGRHSDFWRPTLGIREHDISTGADGVATANQPIGDACDPMWLPLGAPQSNPSDGQPRGPQGVTPPFPAYPSGHATFGAAAFQTVRRFYGITDDGPDDLCDGLPFISDELNGETVDERGYRRVRHERTFPGGLWTMIEENGRSRVFLGVHWLFDAFAEDAAGEMDLGRQIGGVWLGIQVANDLAANGLLASKAAAAG